MIFIQSLMVSERAIDPPAPLWGPGYDDIQGPAHVASKPDTPRVPKNRMRPKPVDGSDTTYMLLKILN